MDRLRATAEPQPAPLRVQTVIWNALGPGSVAYTVSELLDHLPAEAVDRTLWCLRGNPHSPRYYQRPALPELLFRALCKARMPASVQGRLAREVVLRSIAPHDIVYVWPPYDLSLIKRAKERGAIVVAERINCMDQMGREVLSRAFARRGRPLPDGWLTPDAIARECEQMRECDFVTAPNSLVSQSLRDAGIAQQRILETSYGFNPTRLARAIGLERPNRAPVFTFVGVGIVRKGLDVLLEAWEQADIEGTLLIAGAIDDEIRASYSTILGRSDVRELGFVEDVASVYAASDVFVFPSHEEGGPQVTYEAAACGLPSIVSPMGSGRVVRDQREGLIIDPLKVADVAGAIARLAGDEALRRTLGLNAAKRASEFTWAKVAARLYEHFQKIAHEAVRANA